MINSEIFADLKTRYKATLEAKLFAATSAEKKAELAGLFEEIGDALNSIIISLSRDNDSRWPKLITNVAVHYFYKECAYLLGVNYDTYVSWEQGRYPSTPAIALLHVAKYYPEVFLHNRKEIITKLGALR